MSEDEQQQSTATGNPEFQQRLREALALSIRQYPVERKRAEETAKGGLVSRIIGDGPYHATSIAFICVSGLLVILLISVLAMFFSSGAAVDAARITVQGVLTLLGTILGYVFGRSQGS